MLESKSPLRERAGKAERSEMGWRNRWCQLTWTSEAEFKLCIQFKAPDRINSQACLQESAKGINLLLSNTNQDSYPMQFIKSYLHAYLYIHARSQPHSIFCLLYKEKEKNKVCEIKLVIVIKHYFFSDKTIIFYHLQFSFLLFLSTCKKENHLPFLLDFFSKKRTNFWKPRQVMTSLTKREKQKLLSYSCKCRWDQTRTLNQNTLELSRSGSRLNFAAKVSQSLCSDGCG